MKTFVIAEAGVNHNGSVETAKRMIDSAAESGADAIKFQTFKAEKVAASSAPRAQYQVENTGKEESQIEMLKRLELLPEAFHALFERCGERGLVFMSTPFDEESADLLDALGMRIFKISSGEITNKSLIQHIAAKNKPIILSTGMSYLGEVEKAVYWIKEIRSASRGSGNHGPHPDDGTGSPPLGPITLLHCVSNYPASVDDLNLSAMKTLETAFGLPVGYSDHSMKMEIPIAASALGAKVIEMHFTLGRDMEGPDHRASLEPDELKAIIKAIRNVERARGDGIKRPTRSEEDTRRVARKSLVTTRDIKAGNILGPSDITAKRPGSGIPPEFKETVVGMRARRDLRADSLIIWEDLKDA